MIRWLVRLWRGPGLPAPHSSVMPRPWRYYVSRWTPAAAQQLRRKS